MKLSECVIGKPVAMRDNKFIIGHIVGFSHNRSLRHLPSPITDEELFSYTIALVRFPLGESIEGEVRLVHPANLVPFKD